MTAAMIHLNLIESTWPRPTKSSAARVGSCAWPALSGVLRGTSIDTKATPPQGLALTEEVPASVDGPCPHQRAPDRERATTRRLVTPSAARTSPMPTPSARDGVL